MWNQNGIWYLHSHIVYCNIHHDRISWKDGGSDSNREVSQIQINYAWKVDIATSVGECKVKMTIAVYCCALVRKS